MAAMGLVRLTLQKTHRPGAAIQHVDRHDDDQRDKYRVACTFSIRQMASKPRPAQSAQNAATDEDDGQWPVNPASERVVECRG